MRLALVTAMLAIAVGASAQEVKGPPASSARVLQAEGGRFVFGQASDFRADQFMLDTKTGRLWRAVVESDEKGNVIRKLLEPIQYIGPDGKFSPEPR